MTDEARKLAMRVRRMNAERRVVSSVELSIPTTGALLTPEDKTLDRVLDRANREFGDPTKDLGGPELPPQEAAHRRRGK